MTAARDTAPAHGAALAGAARHPRESVALMAATLLIALCGLLYQLVLGTLSSYLVGDSVTQFSLTIGMFLAAMGVGAYASRWIDDLSGVFLVTELALGLIGGWSATLLLAAYAHLGVGYKLVFVLLTLTLGGLIGLELPLLVRWARRFANLRDTIARLFALDYAGALIGGVAFPLLLLPRLGVVRTAFVIGAINVLVVFLTLPLFPAQRRRPIALVAFGVLGVLAAGLMVAGPLVDRLERALYQDPIVHAEQSRYQRIVVTGFQDDLRLFLDRELQFSARDEYRYHEALVHPLLGAVRTPARVLVIGGGDGLVVREVLKHADVRQVDVVDLDPAVTRLGREFAPLRELNSDALADARVRVVNADGFRFVADARETWDAVVVDLPDPRTESIARLYSREFYGMLERVIAPGGALVTQASSPFMVRDTYWTVVASIEAAGFATTPYRTYVPSFGDWGFVLAARESVDWRALAVDVPTRYLDTALLATLTQFPADVARVPVEISTLTRPRVLESYRRESARWR